MASTAPIGSVRDVVADRAKSTYASGSSLQVIPDVALSPWTPIPGAVHTMAVNTTRTLTITDAAVPLPYDLKVGEGFIFYVQNNDGANTLTIAVAGNVTAGAGTYTVAAARTRIFALNRTSATAHVLTTLGVLTH